MRAIITAAAIAALLCGCADAGHFRNIENTGAGQTDFDRDHYECQRENAVPAPGVDVDTDNARVAGIGLAAGLIGAMAQAAANSAATRDCLAARGWQKVSN
jgi:hypothetical protein